MKCRIRIVKEIEDVFPRYRPKFGNVYDAEYIDSSKPYKVFPPVCILNIADKRIIIRKDEFEILGVIKDGSY
jgi:hypothetical protein